MQYRKKKRRTFAFIIQIKIAEELYPHIYNSSNNKNKFFGFKPAQLMSFGIKCSGPIPLFT